MILEFEGVETMDERYNKREANKVIEKLNKKGYFAKKIKISKRNGGTFKVIYRKYSSAYKQWRKKK